MLVTVYKDSQSSFLGAVDHEAIRMETAILERVGLNPHGFEVEVPWSPESGSVLALLLVRWQQAKPTRAVVLMFDDNTTAELVDYSPAQVEFVLPSVKQISIIDLAPPAAK